MRRQVDLDLENPPTLKQMAQTLTSYGFEPISATDYDIAHDLNEIFVHIQGDGRPFAKVNVMGVEILGLLDSGAQRSVLGTGAEKLIRTLKLKIYSTPASVRTAEGKDVPVKGLVHLPITFHNQTRIIPTLVAPELRRRLILGFEDFWRAFHIRPTLLGEEGLVRVDEVESTPGNSIEESTHDLTDEQRAQLETVKTLFKVAIDGETLDVTPLITHKIELREEYRSSPPVRINPYPTSPEMQRKINQEIDKLLSQKVIEKSNSDWSLSTVPVVKPSGEVRLCLDARRLNERTQRDAYPLPHQDRILSRLGASKT